jgi:hypothetical protein
MSTGAGGWMRAAVCGAMVAASLAEPAFANDASIAFLGGVPQVVDEPEVRLIGEVLRFSWVPAWTEPRAEGVPCPADSMTFDTICWRPGGWDADLSYALHNDGDARTLEVGLPFRLPPSDSEHVGPAAGEPIVGLRTFLDDEELPVRQLDDALDGDGWSASRTYVVTVPFEAGQRRELRHVYRAHGGETSSGGRSFDYLLQTGRGWAGPIRHVAIRFELDAGTPCRVASLPARIDDRTVVIELGEWEPDLDLAIEWLPVRSAMAAFGLYDPDDVDVAREECGAVADEDRATIARRIELLHGAPHTDADAELLAAPPRECLWHDAFAAVRHADVEGAFPAWLEAGVDAMRYRARPGWEDTLSPAARACIEVLRTDASQPAAP